MSPYPLALLFLGLSMPALAAENAFDVSTGITRITRTDRGLSPLATSGTMPRFGIGWSRRGERWMHTAGIDLTMGSMASDATFDFTSDGEARHSGPSVATIANIQYAAGRRIEVGNAVLHVGGTSNNQAADMVFYNGLSGLSHYLGAFDLGPWADLRVDVGERHHFGAQGWVPLVAWMGRNPYAIHNAEHIYATRDPSVPLTIVRHIANGSPQTVNHYQAVHTRASWTVDLHDHWSVATTARLDWLHYAVPHPLVELQLGADIALLGRF